MARFISKLANSEPHIHEENYQEFDESTDNDKININESDISNSIKSFCFSYNWRFFIRWIVNKSISNM